MTPEFNQTFDPTATLGLRRSYAVSHRKRWTIIKKLIKEAIFKRDIFGLDGLPELAISQTEDTPTIADVGNNAIKTAAFISWLHGAIDNLVLEKRKSDPRLHTDWQAPFVRQGYSRGLKHAATDVGKIDGRIPDDDPLKDPQHQMAITDLSDEVFIDLEKISLITLTEVNKVIAMGLNRGWSKERLFREAEDRINKIAVTRSLILANTAIVKIVNEAILNRLAKLGIAFVVIGVELTFWKTAGDSRVCPICKAGTTEDNGFGPGVYTLNQARGLLPAHPQCRCRWIAQSLPDLPFLIRNIISWPSINYWDKKPVASVLRPFGIDLGFIQSSVLDKMRVLSAKHYDTSIC